jgi:hypothetical protein
MTKSRRTRSPESVSCISKRGILLENRGRKRKLGINRCKWEDNNEMEVTT